MELYGAIATRRGLPRQHRLILELPNDCNCSADTPEKPQMIFVGQFSERKGLPILLETWEQIRLKAPGQFKYVLIGIGSLEKQATLWAEDRSDVSIYVDPARSVIHRELRRSKVLYLLSQSTDHWQEQIGLPISEGLAHDCFIVATSGTGLASWLRLNHQLVVPEDIAPADLADQVINKMTAEWVGEPLYSLPNMHSREAANEWLHAPHSNSTTNIFDGKVEASFEEKS
ncbi:hypothetical protein B1964_27780 [Gordonia sp. i37]|nr:hypothetical protein B1964_27780 [Gordonia sp. i37]